MAKDIAWLAKNLDHNAGKVLAQLDMRLDYSQFLRESSGFPQTGEGYAISVQAFIQYAQDKGTLTDFLTHVHTLASEKIGKTANGQKDAVVLSTIHQAKGLEWQFVYVPQCNQGTLPFIADPADNNWEEERRLFYVALTRTKQDLHLYTLKNGPISQFLNESRYEAALERVQRVRDLLASDPVDWQAMDARDLIKDVAELGLDSYFTDWWDEERDRVTAVAHQLQQFFIAAEANHILQKLGIQPNQITLWQKMAPLPPEAIKNDFPGLEKFLPRRKRRQRTQKEKQPARYPMSRRSSMNGNPLLANRNNDTNALSRHLSLANRLRRVKELARQGDETAVSGLIASLDDTTSTVRYLARSALVQRGGVVVSKALQAYLAGSPTTEGEHEAQQALKMLSSPGTQD
jgi:DNA helicase-2/ATP-dependent DNA helicase PcrA